MSRGKSSRRDAMFKALKRGSKTIYELIAATGIDVLYVREEICRMKARGEVRQLTAKRRSLGHIATWVYAIEPNYVAPPAELRIREFKPRPRKPAPGSGKRAARCISRALKWDTDWVSI